MIAVLRIGHDTAWYVPELDSDSSAMAYTALPELDASANALAGLPRKAPRRSLPHISGIGMQ